jgi:hypothetical protein
MERRSSCRRGVGGGLAAARTFHDWGEAKKVLDTDTLTLLLQGQPKVIARRKQESDEVVIAVVSRIEVLQGRFATLLKGR